MPYVTLPLGNKTIKRQVFMWSLPINPAAAIIYESIHSGALNGRVDSDGAVSEPTDVGRASARARGTRRARATDARDAHRVRELAPARIDHGCSLRLHRLYRDAGTHCGAGLDASTRIVRVGGSSVVLHGA